MTMPYCPLWRGPTVLNSRTITQSSPRSWWYASARNSSSAFDSAYAQRRAVVGPYWRRLSSYSASGSRRSPYTSDVDATSTRLPKRLQCSSTFSVPWMFVTSVCTGCSTIRRTPTAAARW